MDQSVFPNFFDKHLDKIFTCAKQSFAPNLETEVLKIYAIMYIAIILFLVGAFFEKRVDYSHGFSSVFFPDTPEVSKIVLRKVLQNFMVSN